MAYETVLVDLQNKSQEFQDLYAKSNPLPDARAKVPLLQIVDENFLLCESLVVSEFVAREFAQHDLLPSKNQDVAVMNLFTELCGSSFTYFNILRADKDDAAAMEEAKSKLIEGLVATNAFLKHYNSSPFLFGEKFTLAECNAAPFVLRMVTILPALTDVDPLKLCDDLELSNLKAWIDAVVQRPSVQSTGVSKKELIESTNRMLERFATMATK